MADKKKKKATKMSLVDFLADASGGSSWATEGGGGHDDFVLPSAPTSGPDDFMSGSRIDFTSRSSIITPIDFSKLPKNPPFTAYLGNLPFDTEEIHIEDGLKDCKIVNVNLAKDKNDGRFRGFAYVEFSDLDSLKRALDMNGTLTLQGRKIRFDIAEPPKSGSGMMGASRSTMRSGGMSRMGSSREGTDNANSLDLSAWRRTAPLPEEHVVAAPRSTSRGDFAPIDDSRRERGNFRLERNTSDMATRSLSTSSKNIAATGAPTWRSSHEQVEEPMMSSSSMHSSTSSISSRPLFSNSRSMETAPSRESRPRLERDPVAPSDAERAVSWRK